MPELLRETPYWLPLCLPGTGCRFRRQYDGQLWDRTLAVPATMSLKSNPSYLLASGFEEGLQGKGCLQ